VLEAEPLARAAPAREHLVRHEEDFPPVAKPAQLRKKIIRRHDRPAQTLDRLEHEACDRADRCLVDVLAIEGQVLIRVDRAVRPGPDRPVNIGPRHHVRAWRAHRAIDVRADLAERHRAVGPAVKIVKAADRLMPARRRAQHANARLDRRGAAVVELESVEIAGQHRGELLHQLRLDRRREVVRVHQPRRCPRDALADLRVAVAQRGDVDARGKIDVVVAGTGRCGTRARSTRPHSRVENVSVVIIVKMLAARHRPARSARTPLTSPARDRRRATADRFPPTSGPSFQGACARQKPNTPRTRP